MVLALILVAHAAGGSLPPWHTYSWVGEPTAPYDWYRDRQGCVVGFPTDGGTALRRCGSPWLTEHEVHDVTERRPPSRDEPGLEPLGRWAEVPVEELVLVPSGLPFDGLRHTVHVALKGTPEVSSFQRHPCRVNDCGGPGAWPIDWPVPPTLDGTSIVRGHAVGDRRYAQAWADWSAALLAAAARVRGGEPAPAGVPPPTGLPATRFALIVPVEISGREGWPPLYAWKVEVPVDGLRGGVLTRRSFPEIGVALEVHVGERAVQVRPQDLEVECPDPLEWTTRPSWRPAPPPCNQSTRGAGLRLQPLLVDGDRAALGGRAASVDPFMFEEGELWMTRGLGREPMSIYVQAPYAAELAYAGRDPSLVFAPPPPAASPPGPARSHVVVRPPPVLHFPSEAVLQPDGRVRIGPRDWPVATWYPSDAGTRLDVALLAGASPPRGDAEPAVVLATDLDPAASVSGPWEVPGGLPPSTYWLRLRWTRDGTALMTETLPLTPEPPRGRIEPDTCTPAVSDGGTIDVRDAICPPLASPRAGEGNGRR